MTLQDVYDSEINFSLSTFWDGGFEWKLGDRLNGYRDRGNADTFAKACEEIIAAAVKHWPDSKLAKHVFVCSEHRDHIRVYGDSTIDYHCAVCNHWFKGKLIDGEIHPALNPIIAYRKQ